MRIIAVDIGVGTMDVMLIDTSKILENGTKLVLPSPAQLHRAAVLRAAKARKNLYIDGDTVGGGPFASAVKAHISAGLKVKMTPGAAYSIRNDLSEVEALGIEIVDCIDAWDTDFLTLWLQEVRLKEVLRFLSEYGENEQVDCVTIAVQDHGISPKGVSNRMTRIGRFETALSENPYLEFLLYSENSVPDEFLRMRSAARRAHEELPDADVYVMDTSPAAVLGCLMDPCVQDSEKVLAINFGNGHTLGVLLDGGVVLRGFEAHTRQFADAKLLKSYLCDLLKGKLSNERVFNDGGHGLFEVSQVPVEPDKILVTGPRRSLMNELELGFRYAAPAGDMMMTGPLGLYRALKSRFL
ncbi:MAG: DUF1786 family protein [Methanomassiliicoccales archaeon]